MADNSYFIPITQKIPAQIAPAYGKPAARPNVSQNGPNFGQVFEEKLQENTPLKFSRHAQERLDARNIQLSPESINRLTLAVNKAGAKGAKDSLVLLDDMAFLVSVKNRTVITAVDGDSRKENVFTNIDCAVIV